ncbi:MAG: hypothetical protein ACJA0V_002529 [Planctomycetota bacterium]|jgi:hypothetical protein
MLASFASTCVGFVATALFFAPSYSASVPPADSNNNNNNNNSAGDCFCAGTHLSPVPSQLTGCGNGPLIVPTSPSSSDADCITPAEGGCQTKTGSECTVNVKISFPSSANTCLTVWVMGGSNYLTPTKINNTSDNISLSAKAECKTGGSTPSVKKVSVWKTEPSLLVNGNYDPAPDASYSFTLSCKGCVRPAGPDGSY